MFMSKLKSSFKVYMALVTRKQLPSDDGIWIIKQENKNKN
jgi:hypothetical protein